MIKTGHVQAYAAVAVALLLLPGAALADPDMPNPDKPWSLRAKAGLSYDSNITVEQADASSRIGDSAGVFEVEAGYNLIDTKVNSLQVEYEFSQSLHASLSNFDIQSHAFSVSGSTKIDGVTLGGRYSFYHLYLGGNDFLDMQMVAPRVAWFVVPNVYVQGSYYFFDKNFASAFNNRNATNQQPGLTTFYFFDQSKAYVSLGANYEVEDATGPEFDYDGYSLKAALKLPFDFAQRQGKLKLDYTFMQRYYSNITPSIGVKRREDRSTFRASAELPIVGSLSFSARYQFVNRNSNLPSTSYSENVVEGALNYQF